MTTSHSDEYVDHLASFKWTRTRAEKLRWAGGLCEHCGLAAHEVHHLHYDTLGHEGLGDLEALCKPCHRKADLKRKAEIDREVYWSRVDGWATATYGRDWESSIGSDYASDQFDDWIESKERAGW